MMPELEKGNQEFLQAAMQWLHAVLETRAAAPIPPEHQSNWLWRKPAASPQESKSAPPWTMWPRKTPTSR